MSSLKSKFEDFKEEPKYASWQKLLKQLDAEIPVQKKRRYYFWVLPFVFIGAIALWLTSMNFSAQRIIVDTQKEQVRFAAIADVGEKTESLALNELHQRLSTVEVHEVHPKVTPQKVARYNSNQTKIILQDEEAIASPSSPNTPKPTTLLSINGLTSEAEINTGVKNDSEEVAQVADPNTNESLRIDSVLAAEAIRIKPNEKKEDNFELEIYYAPGISNIILKDPLVKYFTPKTIADNKNLRKGISKIGFSYTTGFGVKMNVIKNLRVKSGYYFTQVNQTLYYNTTTSSCNCGQAVSLSQIDPNLQEKNMNNIGDTISVGNTHSFNNKYALNEIPVVFEYAMPMPKYKNLSTVIHIGFSYMFIRGITARMPDADNVGFVDIINKTANVVLFPSYKDAINTILGYGIVYKAKRNVEWSLAPQFKIAVTSISKNSHWYREYPWQFQVGMGVGKRF